MSYAEINPDAVRTVSPLEQALAIFKDGRFEAIDLESGTNVRGTIAAITVVETTIHVDFRRTDERIGEEAWRTIAPTTFSFDTSVFDRQRRKDMIKLCFESESLPGVSITFIPCNLMRMLRSIQGERDGRTRKAKLLARTIDGLLPLIDSAQLDALEFATPAEVDQIKLGRAIGKMHDVTVSQVIPVSLSTLHPHLDSSINSEPMLRMERLAAAGLIEEDLFNEVLSLIGNCTAPFGHANYGLSCQIWMILAFAVKGQHRDSDRCRDLIPFLRDCYPIGPLKGDSSIWFVAFR